MPNLKRKCCCDSEPEPPHWIPGICIDMARPSCLYEYYSTFWRCASTGVENYWLAAATPQPAKDNRWVGSFGNRKTFSQCGGVTVWPYGCNFNRCGSNLSGMGYITFTVRVPVVLSPTPPTLHASLNGKGGERNGGKATMGASGASGVLLWDRLGNPNAPYCAVVTDGGSGSITAVTTKMISSGQSCGGQECWEFGVSWTDKFYSWGSHTVHGEEYFDIELQIS